MRKAFGAWLCAALGVVGVAVPARGESREACAGREPLRRAFFGDLHVHTRHSLDAQTQGTRNGPREAYRFARGEPIGIQPYDEGGRATRSARLERPLDFAAVTDHAELFGEVTICETPGLPGHDALLCELHRRFPRASYFVMNTLTSYPERPVRRGFCGPDAARCREAARTPWHDIRGAAEAAYDRSAACSFTTFVGYEWTGSTGGNNLHRNVIFRNERVPELPASYVEAPTPEALWRALEQGCLDAPADPGAPACDALVIPHNSNLSGGLMFALDPGAIGPDTARTRAAMEPLVEVMQHKGDSECRPGAGTEDELCAFEKLPYQNFAAKYVPWLSEPPPPSSYVREALKQGLLVQDRIGVNPFAFGLLASTDTHLAAAGLVDEGADYPGHGGAGTPAAHALPVGLVDDVEFNPGGLAVLWAEENSREALFAAMRRREAYGTSGPRLVVRLFAGWDYDSDLCRLAGDAFAAAGYAGGVPMGGVLSPPASGPPAPAGSLRASADLAGPRLAIRALADPGTATRPGAALQRIQIVKGWVEGGVAREAVFDAAGDSGGGVDPVTCTPRDAGPLELCAVWRDPDFDPAAPSFYYARVLEGPTCRWHARACLARGVSCADAADVPKGFEACCDPALPRTIQERAWTSPVWWIPER